MALPAEVAVSRDRQTTRTADPVLANFKTKTFGPAVLAILLGTRVHIYAGIGIATVVAILMLPGWLQTGLRLRRYRTGLLFTAASVVCGLALLQIDVATHDVSVSVAWTIVNHLVGGVLVAGALTVCATSFGCRPTAICYGIGSLLSVAVTPTLWAGDVWKYSLALPVTLIVLGVLSQSRVRACGGLILLAVVDTVFAYRSHAGLCVIGVVLLSIDTIAVRAGYRRQSGFLLGILIVGASILVYQLSTDAALSGRLGGSIQERSTAQVSRSGSLIEGGRPEWTGTVALMGEHPLGFGPGVVPLNVDAGVLKKGLLNSNIGIGGSYVNDYLLGGQFKLHSTAADLWVNFGPVGLLFGLWLFVTFGKAILDGFLAGADTALIVFVTLSSMWFLAFGPILTNWPDICLTLALVSVGGVHRPNVRKSMRRLFMDRLRSVTG